MMQVCAYDYILYIHIHIQPESETNNESRKVWEMQLDTHWVRDPPNEGSGKGDHNTL